MQPGLPDPSLVLAAVETFLRLAYAGTAPPAAVQQRTQSLRQQPPDRFYEVEALERPAGDAYPPARLCLRLGNRFYPHMKLTIDRRPDGQGYIFRADTHDRHCCPPPDHRDYPAFCQLMGRNQHLAQAIEAAWAQQGIPTFKTYLREDLARRAADPR